MPVGICLTQTAGLVMFFPSPGRNEGDEKIKSSSLICMSNDVPRKRGTTSTHAELVCKIQNSVNKVVLLVYMKVTFINTHPVPHIAPHSHNINI